MAGTRSDIAQQAVRMFLEQVGEAYDKARQKDHLKDPPKAKDWREIKAFFDDACCYCGAALSVVDVERDHLVAHNREHGGLQAWGNVVPCCKGCNSEKAGHDWQEFLKNKAGDQFEARRQKIADFIVTHDYRPDIDAIIKTAKDLYEDIGTVAQALVDLRIKHIEAVLRQLHPAPPAVVVSAGRTAGATGPAPQAWTADAK